MDRYIETVGSAWFKTKAVAFPVELHLTSGKQASNIERLKLGRALDTLLSEIVEAGIPAVRMLQPPGGNPMQYLSEHETLQAGTTVECASPEEIAHIHGLATKLEHGDAELKLADLAPVYGEHAADRARAFQRALDAAGQAASAIAQEAKLKLAGLLMAEEVECETAPAMGEDTPRRVGVRLRARFAIA